MRISAVTVDDLESLTGLFQAIDTTYFRPHDMSGAGARSISHLEGQDVYLIGWDGEEAVAYGMLRGWDEGYDTPSLGVAVRASRNGAGFGRGMVLALHDEARRHGSAQVRLRVSPDNQPARRLYESLGYVAVGIERDEILMLFDLG